MILFVIVSMILLVLLSFNERYHKPRLNEYRATAVECDGVTLYFIEKYVFDHYEMESTWKQMPLYFTSKEQADEYVKQMNNYAN